MITEAFIASQRPAIRQCINTVCRDISLDELWKAHTEKAATMRDCLICSLNMIGLSHKKIADVAKVDRDYVRYVLKARFENQIRIRTTSWGCA